MLSTVIPPVSDPSCNLDSDDKTQPQQVEEPVDLQLDESGFDDSKLPTFSIRDYVFNTRSKDIKINWPFSQKSLQLCVNHGIKNVLPPFQFIDSVKTLSIPKYIVESNVTVSSINVGKKLAVDIEKNINLIGSKEDTESPSTSKVELKKCRLTAKPNQETMASKACPVCKTFSSSSNTTLNAHIDQCLSGEPTDKWGESLKVVKHRVKPKKIRLVVDIYSTALHCTLEDLDRRNGTNWASNSEVSAEKKKRKGCSLNIASNNEEGAVYIDASGTKVRILSKFSASLSTSKAIDDCEPDKLTNKDKGLLKKNMYLFEKHKPGHFPEVTNGKQREKSPQENSEDEDPSYDVGKIKKLILSKRPALKKKMNVDEKMHRRDNNTKNLRVNRTTDSNPPLCDENLYLQKRRDSMPPNSQNGCDEEASPRKRVLRSHDFHGNKNHLVFNVKKSNQDEPLVRGHLKGPSYGQHNNVASSSSHKNLVSPRKTSSDHEPSSGCKKSSSFRNNLLASVPESEKNPGIKRRKLCYVPGSDEEAGPLRFSKVLTPAHIEKGSHESSFSRVLSVQKKKRRLIDTNEATFESDSHDDDDDAVEENDDSEMGEIVPRCTSGIEDIRKEVEVRDELVHEPILKEAFESFSRPLDSVFFADKVGHDFTYSVTRAASETGANEGGNYFVDEDLIPIPGPPGSFLPSPGRMDSEEPNGTSSLTTCRIQSSEDDHEHGYPNMESSESPTSTTSMVSDTVNARSYPVSFTNPFMQSNAIQKTQSGFSQETRVEAKGSIDDASQSGTLNNHESHLRQPTYSEVNCESPSNPVLRLMGKNLLVLNKGENPSRIQTTLVNNFQMNDPYQSFNHHSSFRSPYAFDSIQNATSANHVDSNAFRVLANSATLGLVRPFDHFERTTHLESPYMRSGNERIFPNNVPQPANVSHVNNKNKEIIILDDDSAEDEPYAARKMSTRNEVCQLGYYDSKQMLNPYFGGYQTMGYPIAGGNTIVENGNVSALPNSSVFQWNCVPEGPKVMLPPSSQATTHVRSSVYYPSRFL